jgi:PhzF family phenazine biosynthesis protein
MMAESHVRRRLCAVPDLHEESLLPRSHAFAQVDVFGSAPYLGNPVAVILDARDLADEDMQQLARWTNLSETTFVLPPTNRAADYRLRIFTPGGELPFAGHPTLGTAHAWLEHCGTPAASDRVVQECKAGLVTLLRSEVGLSFAAPPMVRTGPLEDDVLDDITVAFGITREQVVAHQWVDNGPGWAVLQLPTAADVLALEPYLSRIPTAMVGAIGAHPDGAEHAFEMRTFAPAIGVVEDPVCGSMNASVGQWLTASGAAPRSYRVLQGARVGRAGSILITTDEAGAVWVGGSTATCIRGTITI